jgi:hypothetical protein
MRMTPLPKIVAAAILAALLATPASADSVTICNDTGDLCVWRKTKPAGSFENPVVDNYPDEYRPGYLHAGMYCAAGNWHLGWLQPWEHAPVIKRSCGRID